MKIIMTIILAGFLCLPFHSAQSDPTPTPMVVYKFNGGYITQHEAKQMQLFITQLQELIVADDPSPQPSINFNLVTERLTNHTILHMLAAGHYIDRRSSCDLMDEAFRDSYGNLLKPESKAEEAIVCGCELLDAGFGIPAAQVAANNVFHYGKDCINF